jgi:uncharacterized protein (TIGR03435 family)
MVILRFRRPLDDIMLRTIWMATMVAIATGTAFSQPADVRPAYEASSVKLNTSESGGSSSNGSKGQIVITNWTLKRLIERAYLVKPFQVISPSWTEAVHFDITAKYPPDTKDNDRALMLRTLLEDRFKLAAHEESKEMPGYALVPAKSGFKLKPADPGPNGMSSNGGKSVTLKATKVSMPELADFVARQLGDTVIDKTGVDGVYDFELRWTSEQAANAGDADAGPSLAAAIQETLGLRLQPQKLPVKIIVVDHVERVPIEN